MALIKVAGIVRESIVDGEGYRYVIFTQGCPHNCPGCHNPQTHDVEGGEVMNTEDLLAEIKENPLLDGVTFSGGEPFLQAEGLAELAPKIHDLGLSITTFTGYTWEQLQEMENQGVKDLLKSIDVLIDGPFIANQRDIDLKFRGSKNQRIIDVKESLKAGKVCLYAIE